MAKKTIFSVAAVRHFEFYNFDTLSSNRSWNQNLRLRIIFR